MEHVYVAFSPCNMNMLLSVCSDASWFAGAVFLFWWYCPDAHTIACPFLCLWIMQTGCTSSAFIFLSFASDSDLIHLLLTKWVTYCLASCTVDKGIVPGLWIMLFKWEYIHSCRKGQFNNLLTIWLLTISEPVDSSVSMEVSDVVQLTWEDHFCCFFEWNLLQCSVSVLELKMSHLYPFRIIHAVSNVNCLTELVLLAEEKYMSSKQIFAPFFLRSWIYEVLCNIYLYLSADCCSL